MVNGKRRWLSVLTALTLAFVMSFSCLESFAMEGTEQTDDMLQVQAGDDQTSLEVIYNGNSIMSFNRDELYEIAYNEDGRGSYIEYNYSAFNANPSFKTAESNTGCLKAKGPKIETLINKALDEVGKDLDDINDSALIKFVASDTDVRLFTKEELFSIPRYYYPNANTMTVNLKNMDASGAAYEGAVSVDAIINMDRDAGTLMFGQRVPSEENYSSFMKYMYSVAGEGGGKIEITDRTAGKWNPVTGTNIGNNTSVPVGTKVYFNLKGTNELGLGYPKFWAYYTQGVNTDAASVEEPDWGSHLYNYNKYYIENDFDINKGVNAPVIQQGKNIIKVKVLGYGKLDSDTVTFEITGYTPAPVVKKSNGPRFTKASAGKKRAKLKWTRMSGMNGYEVYKATSYSGKYKKVKTLKKVSKTSATIKKLKKNKEYFFKVRAYKKVGKKGKSYGDFSSIVRVKAK